MTTAAPSWRSRCAQAAPLVVLGVLVIQNASSMLLQHALQTPSPAHPILFAPLSAVTLSEALKLTISLLVVLWTLPSSTTPVAKGDPSPPLPTLFSTLRSGHELAAIPALLYTLAATAQGIAAYHLDVLSYMMLSQIKLILTPVFAGLFLGQRLPLQQWACIFVLAAGMVLVQHGSTSTSPAPQGVSGRSSLFGAICMLVAGACTAGAGVYMESVLKVSPGRFMARNAQLAVYALLCALGGYLWRHGFDLKEFFSGYHAMVWVLVGLQATGGFLVSWAVSISSSVAKNYAQSLGFLLASTIPLVALRKGLSAELCFGVVLVLGGVFGSLWKKSMAPVREVTREKIPSGDGLV